MAEGEKQDRIPQPVTYAHIPGRAPPDGLVTVAVGGLVTLTIVSLFVVMISADAEPYMEGVNTGDVALHAIGGACLIGWLFYLYVAIRLLRYGRMWGTLAVASMVWAAANVPFLVICVGQYIQDVTR
jgi:hypothetical protein